MAAFGPYLADPTLRARIWRIYMLCWGVKSCVGLPGDFMDVGCYDGRTVEIMERYCNFQTVPDKTWWLYDMFENPPQEARKASHGPQLFERRSEEHTSELQSLMRISYAVFCLKTKNTII